MLTWRYGFAPLHYRCLLAGDRIEDGVVVFRLRARGAAVEAVVCQVLVPARSPVRPRRLLGSVLRDSGADYLLATRSAGVSGWLPRATGIPLPGQGPVLTWRPLADHRVPDLTDLALTMGDVELF